MLVISKTPINQDMNIQTLIQLEHNKANTIFIKIGVTQERERFASPEKGFRSNRCEHSYL